MRQWNTVVVLAAAVAMTLGLGGLQARAQKASPFNGTWKLNAANTKFTVGTPPKEQTLMIEEAGNDQVWTVTGNGADGKPFSAKTTYPMKGGKGMAAGHSPWDEVTIRDISPRVREISNVKGGGKMMLRLHYTVSKDGKTMRETIRGTNFRGQRRAGVLAFDKQ